MNNKILLFLAALIAVASVVSCKEGPIEPDQNEQQQSTALKVISIDPVTAPVGEKVVITGENFGSNPMGIKVTFGEAAAQLVTLSETSLTAIVPKGEGDVEVYVSKGDEKAGPLAFTYEYVEVPPVPAKPVVLWIDAEANFYRLRSKSNIKGFLDKAQENGFNAFVVDVKPVQGDVLYNSSFLPKCTYLAGNQVDRDWDYLQFFLDEAHKRNMRVTVSTTIMTMGLPQSQTGPGYQEYPDSEYDINYWDDKFCIEHLPEGLVDIRESRAWDVFAFLNPVLPEVHDYVMRMVTELVTNYDFDGYILDYCRYMNMNSDFSEASKKAFEEYAGVTCTDFPNDIYYYAEGVTDKTQYTPAKYYNQWVEWRASVIQGYVKDIRETIKAIKPEVDVEYWAAAWWPLPHTGQNWTSYTYTNYSYWWKSANYPSTGFAEYLDIFQLGAYYDTVGDVTNAITRAKSITKGVCDVFGTISAASTLIDLEKACYTCLKNSDGLMVFELSHIINNQAWSKIKTGVKKAETELGIEREY